MRIVNYEFKARIKDEQRVRDALKTLNARSIGTDHQVTLIFASPPGG